MSSNARIKLEYFFLNLNFYSVKNCYVLSSIINVYLTKQ
jgi:hypothetical protein